MTHEWDRAADAPLLDDGVWPKGVTSMGLSPRFIGIPFMRYRLY